MRKNYNNYRVFRVRKLKRIFHKILCNKTSLPVVVVLLLISAIAVLESRIPDSRRFESITAFLSHKYASSTDPKGDRINPNDVTVDLAVASQSGLIEGVAKIVDGDTIDIDGTRIRLFGIDAPEMDQVCQRANGSSWRCGEGAALSLRDFIGHAIISCQKRDADQNRPIVAVCRKDDGEINGWMVRNGWAVANSSLSTAYVGDEAKAKSEKVGVWQGPFILPWDWRKGERLHVASTLTRKCGIKGNIDPNGARVFHVPGDRQYEETRINEAAGEKWFCSEHEALAAGWRKARP